MSPGSLVRVKAKVVPKVFLLKKVAAGSFSSFLTQRACLKFIQVLRLSVYFLPKLRPPWWLAQGGPDILSLADFWPGNILVRRYL